MHPRLAAEWSDIVSVYSDAAHHTAPERVELTIELDPGQYTTASTAVCVLIPPGYPATGPDGFLVPSGLVLRSNEALPVSDGSGLGMPGWLLMSFHMTDANGQSTWRPTADPSRGDNIVGYVASIEAFLHRGCN